MALFQSYIWLKIAVEVAQAQLLEWLIFTVTMAHTQPYAWLSSDGTTALRDCSIQER